MSNPTINSAAAAKAATKPATKTAAVETTTPPTTPANANVGTTALPAEKFPRKDNSGKQGTASLSNVRVWKTTQGIFVAYANLTGALSIPDGVNFLDSAVSIERPVRELAFYQGNTVLFVGADGKTPVKLLDSAGNPITDAFVAAMYALGNPLPETVSMMTPGRVHPDSRNRDVMTREFNPVAIVVVKGTLVPVDLTKLTLSEKANFTIADIRKVTGLK